MLQTAMAVELLNHHILQLQSISGVFNNSAMRALMSVLYKQYFFTNKNNFGILALKVQPPFLKAVNWNITSIETNISTLLHELCRVLCQQNVLNFCTYMCAYKAFK